MHVAIVTERGPPIPAEVSDDLKEDLDASVIIFLRKMSTPKSEHGWHDAHGSFWKGLESQSEKKRREREKEGK